MFGYVDPFKPPGGVNVVAAPYIAVYQISVNITQGGLLFNLFILEYILYVTRESHTFLLLWKQFLE